MHDHREDSDAGVREVVRSLLPGVRASNTGSRPRVDGPIVAIGQRQVRAGLQAIVKEKDEAVALLGQEPVIPRIDNKIVCGNCHKKRAGGPRDGFNTSDAEYMSMARERKSSHPSWCPGACIPKFCKRPHAHSDTPEGRAVLRSSRPYTRSERSRRSFSPRPRARGKAIVDCEKARTGSTNGKNSQLQQRHSQCGRVSWRHQRCVRCGCVNAFSLGC